ncbi:MAG: hypothetical protein H7096_01845 [Flavobacterium sp.]|nr:hypothetical protein [Pedobacter sp.]
MNSLQSIKQASALILLSGSILFTGCKKDGGTSLPAAAVSTKVAFGIKTDNTTLNLVAANSKNAFGISAASSILWSSGIANIKKFEFEAKRNGTKISIETKNLTNVDLFALSPSLISVTLDSGTYKEIEVKVQLAKSATAIPVTLKGTFSASNGAKIPVELYVNEDLTIKMESENVVIDNSKDVLNMVNLHLDKILATITAKEFENAVMTDNKIIISSSSNENLYNKIKVNVPHSGDNKTEKVEKGEIEKKEKNEKNENGG